MTPPNPTLSRLPIKLPSMLILKDGHDSQDPKQTPADMTAFVQNLLQQMLLAEAGWAVLPIFLHGYCRLAKYLNSEKNVFLDVNALDDMGNRINELEQSINDLRAEMGVESSPSPAAAKPSEEMNKEEGSA
ncbi:heat shock factor-binding protein [Spatholobus suberectus]|nr:heat shock factor-binding protein [Spatholobus suberectus]